MPELGESVTEGTVTRWLKKVGESVGVDEPLVEVSTDKVDTEIPSPVAGTLLSITAQGGRHRRGRRRAGQDRGRFRRAGPLRPLRAPAAPAPAPAAPAPAPAPEPKPEPKPEPSLSLHPQPPRRPQPLRPHRHLKLPPPLRTVRRASPRWCGSWPRRTVSTSQR